MIKICIKLTKSKLISEDNFYKKYINKISRTTNNIDEHINFIVDNNNDNDNDKKNIQKGGNISNTFSYILQLYILHKTVFCMFDNV